MIKNFLLISFAALILAGCVSSKKYKASQADVSRLNGEVAALNTKVKGLDSNVNVLTAQNNDLNGKLQSCLTSAEDLRKKNERIEGAINDQVSAMQNVKTKMSNGLGKYADQGAEVTYKDGMVHVSLPNQLLFKSGSSNLSKTGKDALSSVASVLNESPDNRVIVMGHTDSTAHKGYKDNWSLSTERANSVVRILNKDYNVDPARLISSGRSKYVPVAENTTSEGRQKNNRVEIILAADMTKLWEIPEGS